MENSVHDGVMNVRQYKPSGTDKQVLTFHLKVEGWIRH